MPQIDFFYFFGSAYSYLAVMSDREPRGGRGR
jgi:hypothetical protein